MADVETGKIDNKNANSKVKYNLKARDKFKFRVLWQLVRHPGNLCSRLQNNRFPLSRAHTKFKRVALRECYLINQTKDQIEENLATYVGGETPPVEHLN